MIGTKLAHYEITSHLGTGGMGEVYQATDSKVGRSVAIKLLPEAFAQDAERVARFEREARVLASLNHPNIAAIYGVEESGGRKFLVMELVPGETLAPSAPRRPAKGRFVSTSGSFTDSPNKKAIGVSCIPSFGRQCDQPGNRQSQTRAGSTWPRRFQYDGRHLYVGSVREGSVGSFGEDNLGRSVRDYVRAANKWFKAGNCELGKCL
jgi:hypothetical protein